LDLRSCIGYHTHRLSDRHTEANCGAGYVVLGKAPPHIDNSLDGSHTGRFQPTSSKTISKSPHSDLELGRMTVNSMDDSVDPALRSTASTSTTTHLSGPPVSNGGSPSLHPATAATASTSMNGGDKRTSPMSLPSVSKLLERTSPGPRTSADVGAGSRRRLSIGSDKGENGTRGKEDTHGELAVMFTGTTGSV